MRSTHSLRDRSSLVRLASTLPVGSEDRRVILQGLRTSSAETDTFWSLFSKFEQVSQNTGIALANLLIIDSQDKAWLKGTANRAHLQRAKICSRFLKDLKMGTDSFLVEDLSISKEEIVPLLTLCKVSAALVAKAQGWSPQYDSVLLEKPSKKVFLTYASLHSKYPSVARYFTALW